MINNVLEISKRSAKGGRVPIKIALLKIHEDANETNRNGIHWDETCVKNAMESAISMPICAEFIDEDKSIPLGHGLTGIVINDDGISEPVFENSETVGCFESGMIENININGNEIKALTAKGYLFNQRYPSFVKWVRENYTNQDIKDVAKNSRNLKPIVANYLRQQFKLKKEEMAYYKWALATNYEYWRVKE